MARSTSPYPYSDAVSSQAPPASKKAARIVSVACGRRDRNGIVPRTTRSRIASAETIEIRAVLLVGERHERLQEAPAVRLIRAPPDPAPAPDRPAVELRGIGLWAEFDPFEPVFDGKPQRLEKPERLVRVAAIDAVVVGSIGEAAIAAAVDDVDGAGHEALAVEATHRAEHGAEVR